MGSYNSDYLTALVDPITAGVRARVRGGALGGAPTTNDEGLAVHVISSLAVGGGGGGPATIADGADTTQGALADAKVVGDVAGSLSAKLRGINTILNDAWDSVNHRLNVEFGNSSINVGNFPATQPVSLAAAVDVSDKVGRLLGHVTVDNASLAVTGTFFQATQPVSLATNTPDVTDRAARLLGVVASITNALPAGTNRLGLVRPVDSADADLTAAKGVQTARFLGVTDAKDAGRVNIMWTLEFSPAAVAEALMTMTESRDGAAVGTFSSKAITNGKRLRITGWGMTVENTLGTNPKRAKLRFKFNTAGAVTTASSLQANLVASCTGTVNTVGNEAFQEFPDGVEYLGDGTKQYGFTLEFPDWVTAAQTGKVYVTITAFEY